MDTVWGDQRRRVSQDAHAARARATYRNFWLCLPNCLLPVFLYYDWKHTDKLLTAEFVAMEIR